MASISSAATAAWRHLLPAVMAVPVLAAAFSAAADGGRPAGAGEPLIVIDGGELQRAGLQRIDELLGDGADYNAFGLYRPRHHGMVLVDGRLPPQLDAIPLAAVERIEIFAPGAGPFERGGARAGTVNVVLKRGFEGAAVHSSGAKPAGSGGESGHLSALVGGKVGRAQVTVAADGFQRSEVRWADREYSRASYAEGGSFAGAAGISIGGNTMFIDTPDGAIARPLGDCAGEGYTGVLANPGGYPGAGCGFAYADISWETPRREKRGVLANVDLPVNETTTAYATAYLQQEDTLLRWAPSVGPLTFAPTAALRADLLNDPEIDQVPDTISLSHRYTGHGNREWEEQITAHYLTFGLRGRVAAGVDYDASLRSERSELEERSGTFVSAGLMRTAVEEGRYDPENPLSTEPGHRAAVRETGLRGFRDRLYRYDAARAALNGAAFALPAGAVRWTAGASVGRWEHSEASTWRTEAGEARDDPLGASLSGYGGERRTRSLFAGVELPLRRDWTVTVGTRWDDHEDVGAVWSHRVAGVWRPHRILSLRGSWAAGRLPPALNVMYADRTVTYPFVCDTANHDGTLADCDRIQIESAGGGNPDLGPDERQAWSLGATGRVGMVTVGADWFHVETADGPGQIPNQSLIDLAARGQPLPPGASVVREAGRISEIVNPLVNTRESTNTGVDVRAAIDREIGQFAVGYAVRWNHMIESEAKVAGAKVPGDFPHNRLDSTVSLGWRNLTARWNAHSISRRGNSDGSGHFESWVGHDLMVRWREPFGLKGIVLDAGVLNIADRGPSTDSTDPEIADVRIDSILGRTLIFAVGVGF